jgi:hypothetical protein
MVVRKYDTSCDKGNKRCDTAQHVSGVFPPKIRSSITAVAASGFTFVSW